MRRYQRNRDMMSYAEDPASSFKPPQMPSQLDPKDERLLELSAEVGNLQGQLDMVAEDNGRLEGENSKLKERNQELKERNLELERKEYANKNGFELAEEIREALKKMKGKK